MTFLLIIFSLMMPRLILFVLAIATDYIDKAYETSLWPFLGFLFMPYTTLAYMAAMINNDHQVSGGWLVFVIVAAIVDLSGQSETAKSR